MPILESVSQLGTPWENIWVVVRDGKKFAFDHSRRLDSHVARDNDLGNQVRRDRATVIQVDDSGLMTRAEDMVIVYGRPNKCELRENDFRIARAETITLLEELLKITVTSEEKQD
jgi:hypothetical protein